ncbi:MAG TPA: hypothetical protein QF564_00445 [Pirellulaceae bacterium]|nr:hypothetical protein [Pirellulaceae bacterium]
MAVFRRRDHLLDRVDLLGSELLWRASRTGCLVIECAAFVTTPSDPDSVEGEAYHSHNDDGQRQQCSKLGDSTAKLNHFMLEPHGVEIKNVERHDFSGWLVEPAARC